MKALFLTSISLFAMVACTQQAPPTASPVALLSLSTAGGPTSDTTSAFDGTYQGLAISGNSGRGRELQPRDPYTAGCQPFAVPPTMTITNGLAQFQAVGAVFSGYVTPQGVIRLDSGRGAIVTVNFDPQTRIFRGQANSINCRYDVAWQKA